MRLKHTNFTYRKQSGFTIVELLIVIVVIAILAALVITAYTSVSAQSHDTAVKSDLSNIAKKIKLYRAEHDVYPAGNAQLATLDIRVSKNSYGSHYTYGSSTYNLLYCRMPAAEPTNFALVAFSKSGEGFMYSNDGKLTDYTGSKSNSGAICTAAGVPMSGQPSERDWFYNVGAWQSYVGS